MKKIPKGVLSLSLKDFCTHENVAWENELYTAYHYLNEIGESRTIFEYRIPFESEKEAVFLAKYKIEGTERMKFYQNLVLCIQQQLNVSNYLCQSNVPSILGYKKVEQDRDESEAAYIRLETEHVEPIMKTLFRGAIPISTLTSALYRLTIIFRDISKEPENVVHRGLDMNEVYLNADNRILLGGFYYASYPESPDYPEYLPQHSANIPKALLQGNRGSQATDLQSLSIVAWNLFSGHPVNAKLSNKRLVFPEYASNDMAEALLIGLQGKDENCASFRRRFNECRKAFTKEEFSNVKIPIVNERLKEFKIEYV